MRFPLIRFLACLPLVASSVVAFAAEGALEPFVRTGHAHSINAVAFSFDGAYMVTGGSDAAAVRKRFHRPGRLMMMISQQP